MRNNFVSERSRSVNSKFCKKNILIKGVVLLRLYRHLSSVSNTKTRDAAHKKVVGYDSLTNLTN